MSKDKLPFHNYQHPDKFGQWLGYEIIKLDCQKGEAELRLTLRSDHLSLAGRVHGGVVSAFLDFACGSAVFTTMDEKDFASTVDMHVNYFKPLGVGESLKAQAKLIHGGNRLRTAQATLYLDGHAEPVAMATATFYVVKPKD
jgi:acyl-CoA thioesterase